jgi:hypothetical protein
MFEGHSKLRAKVFSALGASVLLATVVTATPLLAGSASANPPAAFTTTDVSQLTGACLNGNSQDGTADVTNCNIYGDVSDVWLNGGPAQTVGGDGTYFFAVLSPGGQADPNDGTADLLSTDSYTNRTFTVSGGTVFYSGTHLFDSVEGKIQLMPYSQTPNPGGVYILAICQLLPSGFAQPVTPSSCKYDAFKVQSNSTVQPPFVDPTVTKSAAGAYTDTWTWGITKAVNTNKIETTGNATFNYTVTVTHDSGTISGVTVTGLIDVTNPNFNPDFSAPPLTLSDVTDLLSDGTVCPVDTSGTVAGTSTLTLNDFNNYFPYTCALSALPQGELDNTATADWGDQVLINGAEVTAGSANFTFSNIVFTPTLVDNSVTVTDSVKGALGTVSETDPSPTTFNYSETFAATPDACVFYPNTATFTATDNPLVTGNASQTVQVCGPVAGGLTIGFWQNKNGQAIITGQAKTGICPSTTWLRAYAPFQDLSSTATCSQFATYVTNIIKAASAAGAAMNPMLKAQMLATALDVYFSNPSLGGNKIGAPAPLGSQSVDLTNIWGTGENTSAAFGGATSLTVSQLLTYAAGQSNVGGTSWYGQNKTTQGLAKDTFDAINNGEAFI